ncbi:nuclear transport factor 2 family protein [Halomonas sp. HK25]|uniref:nuclear transport factor 2 family protein n=1 Tax=Halomonas sp. HK25 TaxID=3394321 RepID=UPI0039FB9F7B
MAATADERLEAFCAFFNKLDKSCTTELYRFYTPDVLFIDPLHRIEGARALEGYFATLYENVTACRFTFHERQISGDQAFTTWTMSLTHPRLDGGREIQVDGCSHLTFAEDGRVVRHRDYFDAGALLYERLPLLGGAIRLVKKRIDG